MYFLILSAAIVAIHIIHGLTLSRIIQHKEVIYSSKRVQQSLDGCRLALVTDVHNISHKRLEKIVGRISASNVDALLLGGDFSEDRDFAAKSIEVLSKTKTKYGIYGAEGNHDNHEHLFACMEKGGIIPLSNSGVSVCEGLFIAGTEDLWNRKPNISTAIQNANKGDFVILISHNPDVTIQQDTTGADLVVCGHTHGGQVSFFGIWAPVFTFSKRISQYGQKFREGWAKSKIGTPVYTSRGIEDGTTGVPRIFTQPQVVYITLQST